MRNAIDLVQPFRGRYQGLWDLQVLAAEYRHRVIDPIAVLPRREMFQVLLDGKPVRAEEMEIFTEYSPIKAGDKVMDFSVTGVPEDRYEDVRPQIAILMGLDHRLGQGRDLIGILNRIKSDVIDVVENFTAEFFS